MLFSIFLLKKYYKKNQYKNLNSKFFITKNRHRFTIDIHAKKLFETITKALRSVLRKISRDVQLFR